MILKYLTPTLIFVLFLLPAAFVCKGDANDGLASGTNSPAMASNSIHLLEPSDKLQIIVYQEDDLKTVVTLDEKGVVMLPLLGKVKLGGLTVEGATKLLQDAYNKDYLVDPQINIIVEQYAPRLFSVLGEVQKPGSFPIPDNQTVNILEAIAQAGGYTRLGSPEKVSVRRLVNGETTIYKLNADTIAKEKGVKLFEMQPDDVVIVGERTF